MSALEFEEWKVYIKLEQLHPSADLQRHAQLLAAAYQGPQMRRGKTAWSAADFMSVDPWSPAPALKVAPRGSAARQIQALNRRRSK